MRRYCMKNIWNTLSCRSINMRSLKRAFQQTITREINQREKNSSPIYSIVLINRSIINKLLSAMIMTSEQQQQIDHGNLSRFKTNTIIYIECAKKQIRCAKISWNDRSRFERYQEKNVWKLTSCRIISNSSCELH